MCNLHRNATPLIATSGFVQEMASIANLLSFLPDKTVARYWLYHEYELVLRTRTSFPGVYLEFVPKLGRLSQIELIQLSNSFLGNNSVVRWCGLDFWSCDNPLRWRNHPWLLRGILLVILSSLIWLCCYVLLRESNIYAFMFFLLSFIYFAVTSVINHHGDLYLHILSTVKFHLLCCQFCN